MKAKTVYFTDEALSKLEQEKRGRFMLKRLGDGAIKVSTE